MSKKVIYKENEKIEEIDIDDLKDLKDIEIIDDDDDDDWEEHTVRGKIISITPIVCTIVFLLLGFLKGLWHPGWVVFLLIPIVPILLNIFSGKRKGFRALLILLIIASYFVMGTVWHLWHPGWIVFLLIPIVSIIFGGKND